MKQAEEHEFSHPPITEQAVASVSAVVARMADALWQADASGRVSSITLCRPAVSAIAGALDEAELQQIEQLWRKSVRCAERFSTTFHVRSPAGSSARSFVLQAIPVLGRRCLLSWPASKEHR